MHKQAAYECIITESYIRVTCYLLENFLDGVLLMAVSAIDANIGLFELAWRHSTHRVCLKNALQNLEPEV